MNQDTPPNTGVPTDPPKRRPLAWRAHLENYAELYELARNTPTPTKKGLNSKQRAKARAQYGGS